MRILKALDEVAEDYKATPAQVSLAWLIRQPGITSPIASATSVTQFQDIAKAVDLELDSLALDKLNTASAINL